MAIVHPAFCVVVGASMEPFAVCALTITNVGVADTKHFKNRVYSRRTVDVFSGSINAARQ
jgi:hypothetical protein